MTILQIKNKRKGTESMGNDVKEKQDEMKRDARVGGQREQRKNQPEHVNSSALRRVGGKTEDVQTSLKIKMVAQGLGFQCEVCGEALGAPLKNTRAICSVID